jgi:hypothetical protein
MKTETKIAAPWDGPPPVVDQEAERRAALDRLRAKFPPESVGKLPRATSKDARPGKCGVCGGWHKLPAVHLDYVGHAEVTDRLLSVDPLWDWAPLSFDAEGMPRFIRSGAGHPVGLWIKLTVCGVTRLGYGSVDGGAFDAEKQLIGDALRNAAMRFGVALNLWSKNELESTLEVEDTPAPAAPPDLSATPASMASDPVWDKKEPEAAPLVIQGIPIHTTKTWEQIRTLPLGGKSKWQHVTLGTLVEDDDVDPEALDYFEETAVRAVLDLWNRMTPAKKAAGIGLASECVLVAYKALLDRRSPPPSTYAEAIEEEQS